MDSVVNVGSFWVRHVFLYSSCFRVPVSGYGITLRAFRRVARMKVRPRVARLNVRCAQATPYRRPRFAMRIWIPV